MTARSVDLTRPVIRIAIALTILVIIVVGGFALYRRSMTNLTLDEAKPVSGVRLTAEALHRLASPPWRIVYEIGSALGGVDHVVIGPSGVIAITTVVADRPDVQQLTDASSEAQLVSDAAVARGPVDELARPAGAECRLAARVFWGAPDAKRPSHDDVAHGLQLVEGQRLDEWITTQPPLADFGQAEIDLAWQAIVMGIGRPNPLT